MGRVELERTCGARDNKRAAEDATPRRLYLPLVLADRRLW